MKTHIYLQNKFIPVKDYKQIPKMKWLNRKKHTEHVTTLEKHLNHFKKCKQQYEIAIKQLNLK